MGFFIGRDREARRAYGFDEVALVPGSVTINPEEVDITWSLGEMRFEIPFLASAMDGVVDVAFARALDNLGGIAVLNLEGIQTRYEHPEEILRKIARASPEEATEFIQRIYDEPVKECLISRRIEELKEKGGRAVVSSIPQKALRFAQIAQEAGCDIFVIQSTVATVRHYSTKYEVLDFKEFGKLVKIPFIVGNCVTYEAALELMETGCEAILVGVGPGAACTTRGVLGIGVPQVTATIDCAQARDYYYKKTGRYVSVITDGGMSTGGDVAKAFASGADAVMIGSAFARSREAPGQGYHWGMAHPHPALPRGTRIKVGTRGTLEQILFGPAAVTDGSQNIVGAIRTAMGVCGVTTIPDMHKVEMVIAPAITTEGKSWQMAQSSS